MTDEDRVMLTKLAGAYAVASVAAREQAIALTMRGARTVDALTKQQIAQVEEELAAAALERFRRKLLAAAERWNAHLAAAAIVETGEH